MEGISVNVGAANKPQKKHTVLKQVANAAVVGGTLYAAPYAAKAMVGTLPSYNARPLGAKRKAIGEYLMKLGEKLFPKNSSIHETMEVYAKKFFAPEKVDSAIRQYKGKWAAIGLVGAAALTVLTAGIYKAGKINGEGKQ